jgi:hypothetical protein
MSSQNDTGNHRVPQFARAVLPVSQRHEITGLLGRGRIKSSDPSLEFIDKDLFESLIQYGASLPEGQNLQFEANLENRNGSRPDGGARLFIEPVDYFLVRGWTHERRKHFRVDNKDRSKDAGLVSYPRSSKNGGRQNEILDLRMTGRKRDPHNERC